MLALLCPERVATMRTHILFAITVCAVSSQIKLPLSRRPPALDRRAAPLHVADARTPLQGNFPKDGEYYVDVSIGGQHLSLLVDTGSSDVGLSSAGCNGCTHKDDQPYDPKQSPNATALGCAWCTRHRTNGTSSSCQQRPGVHQEQCTFRVSYDDDSGFSAALWEDDFQLGLGSPPTRSVVGAMYEARFPNPKSVDGIIGLAGVGESDSGATTPFDDLVQQGHIDNVMCACARVVCLCVHSITWYLLSTYLMIASRPKLISTRPCVRVCLCTCACVSMCAARL